MIFGRKKNIEKTRTVERFDQLHVGDLVAFKFREVLPEGLSGETLSVESVNTYDYAGQLVSDISLSHSSGLKVNATFDADREIITFSHKIRHPEIIEIFDGDELASIFDPDSSPAVLNLRSDAVSADREAWVCERYTRTLCEGQAYYYSEDRRESGISSYEDDSTPFTYHELEGSSDHHSLSIEIWEDGETEFFAEISVSLTAVESYLTSG
ncbi:hypothetical protein NBRC116583_20070 [Arenicella sp. 4NH20-0111]|uniref:hypothetical protein n=1 Tax=Arenicella sp. 4NH20-0111 TaxID=3127648 RepID=UPI00310A228E